VHDVRYFHKFGEDSIAKEVSRQEITFAELQERGLPTEPNAYLDSSKVAALFGEGRATSLSE
jgi:hypothetical protein